MESRGLGCLLRMQGVTRDVRGERVLREAEASFQQTGLPVFLQVSSIHLEIKEVNTPLLGYLHKEHKNINLKGYMHPYVYCSIIYNSQIMEAAQVSINR